MLDNNALCPVWPWRRERAPENKVGRAVGERRERTCTGKRRQRQLRQNGLLESRLFFVCRRGHYDDVLAEILSRTGSVLPSSRRCEKGMLMAVDCVFSSLFLRLSHTVSHSSTCIAFKVCSQ